MSNYTVGFTYEEVGTCIVSADSPEEASKAVVSYLDTYGTDALKVDITSREFQANHVGHASDSASIALLVNSIDWDDDEEIIYNPENYDNDFEQSEGYTGADFLELCDGDKEMAQRVYDQCDWQHPETIIDEMKREDNNE